MGGVAFFPYLPSMKPHYLLLLLFLPLWGHGQAYDKSWLLGTIRTEKVVFNSNSIDTSVFNDGVSPIYVLRSLSNIADSSGNILFFINGGEIGNANKQLLENGDTLIDSLIYLDNNEGSFEPQSNII